MRAGRVKPLSTPLRVTLTGLVVVALAALIGLARQSSDTSAKKSLPTRDGFLPTADLPDRVLPAVAALGNKVFVWGGQVPAGSGTDKIRFMNDGALLDPRSGKVTLLPDANLPALFEPTAVAIGDQVMLLGPDCEQTTQPQEGETAGCASGHYSAALFTEETDSWSPIDLPDELIAKYGQWSPGDYRVSRSLGTTSDGRAVFVLGSPAAAQYWTYAPASKSWQKISGPPTEGYGACLAGDKLAVLNLGFLHNGKVLEYDPTSRAVPGETETFSPDDGFVDPAILSLDLAVTDSQWTTSPSGDVHFSATLPPFMTCAGDAVIVQDAINSSDISVLPIAANAWVHASLPPLEPSRGGSVIWTGKELVFLPLEIEVGKAGLAYSPGTDSWRELSGRLPAVTRQAKWNGSEIVGYSEPLQTADYLPPPKELPAERSAPRTLNPGQAGVFAIQVGP